MSRFLFLSALLMCLAMTSIADTAADALFAEGMASAKAGHWEEAAAAFRKGCNHYPKDARFPIELAGVSYREKQVAAAKRWLLRGLKLKPDDAYANEFLGTLYELDGNLAATLKYWNRIGAPFLSGVVFRPDTGMDAALRARLFVFSGGQIFTGTRLDTTEANLLRTDLLASVRIDLVPGGEKQYAAIVDMQPKAAPLSGWAGFVLPLVRDLPYQGVDLDWYDIHGRGANFTSLWRWDPDKRRIDLRWRAPVRGNPKHEYVAWVDARDERWDLRDSYQTGIDGLPVRSVSAGADYITGLSDGLQWTVGATAERHVFGAGKPDSSFLFANAWNATVNNRFDYQLWSLPEHRLRAQTWGVFDAGRVLTSVESSRLLTARGGIGGEWFPQAKGDTYRLTSQAQTGRTWGDAPLDSLFQVGMERDTERDLWLRGLRSAIDGRKGTGLLGREYAITQTTFERQIFHLPFVTFAVGPFFDASWVSDPDGKLLNQGAASAAGLQASVKTIGGVGLTLVYGRDLETGRGAFYTATSR